MNIKPTISRQISSNDYYERNYKAQTLTDMPIYFFDIEVIQHGFVSITLTSPNQCLSVYKILVLAPSGRVIKSTKGNNELSFYAKQIGKYVIKMWILHACDNNDLALLSAFINKPKSKNLYNEEENKSYLHELYGIFNLNVYSKLNTIDQNKTNIRVYSLLGAKREGTLYKGEQIKEKCAERYVPQII
jgi:hypothetical protein